MKNKFNNIYLFWAAMDFLYIVRFVWLNILQGSIPLIDDILSFSKIYPEHGVSSVIIFSTSLLLNISIIFSFILLVKKWKRVNFLFICKPLSACYFSRHRCLFFPGYSKASALVVR